MTHDRGFKQLVRDRAKRTGESYSAARAHLRRRGALADTELVVRCAAPIVRRLRGADPVARQAVVPGLTRAQGSLFAFWILFARAGDGLTGLCRLHPHRLVDPGFWILIETGLRDDAALLGIVARLRSEVRSALDRTEDKDDYSWLDRLDADAMHHLDAEFQSVLPGSLHRMANQIRSHPDRFRTEEMAV